jgi:hypothetical protein
MAVSVCQSAPASPFVMQQLADKSQSRSAWGYNHTVVERCVGGAAAPAGFSLLASVARVTRGARAPEVAAAAGASPSVTTFLRRLLLCHDSRARQLLLGWDNTQTQCRHP